VLGRDELVSVRPEKIRLVQPGVTPGPGEHAVAGTVREVIYVGSATRYLVDLSVGGELAALEQNVDRPRTDASQLRGQPVTLIWNREFETRIGA
jgi:putative spermidine/putrescine transport system ATP-binding protein